MKLISWGSGGCGVLATGSTDDHCLPIIAMESVDFASVHLGGTFAIALSSDQPQVYLWGSGVGSQEDTKDSMTKPHRIDMQFESPIKQVACGWECAILTLQDGSIWAIGSHGLNEPQSNVQFVNISNSFPAHELVK